MDNFDSRYGRGTSKTNGSVDAEVQRLLRKGGKVTTSEFMKLRGLGRDEEIVNKIQAAYLEKQGNITKKAKKFAQLIREKYADSQTPFHLLLEKAHKYKLKYGLSDDEFAEFQRIYEQELVGIKSSEVIQPFTNIQKLLGPDSIRVEGFTSKLSDSDAAYLQEIVRLHESSRGLHAQVLLQSMQYQDLDTEAMTGVYERNLHKVGEHIHPVVAALFLPKFAVVENFFLFSNLAGIVKSKYEREELKTLPDYELFYALSTDPNDVVCDNKSTVADLLTRARVQTQLWNNVLALRNGQYYNASFKEFVGSVDSCRLNKQDTPDLVYGRYDGVIIKRLLAAFSFRPTIVSTLPVVLNNVALNPYALNVKPQVTSVPMINMRIPPSLGGIVGAPPANIRLNDALQQYQFFIEGGQIVPRNTTLIWSRGVLIFYVDRRATTVTINDQLNQFSMARLPTPIAGFEKINKRPVEFDETLNVGSSDVFQLRSVVYSEVNIDAAGVETNTVIGSSTLLRAPGIGGSTYFCYDPYGPISGATPADRLPIQQVAQLDAGDEGASFTHLARTRGTVFVYATDAKWDEKKEFSA
jgi:hypothetical protein